MLALLAQNSCYAQHGIYLYIWIQQLAACDISQDLKNELPNENDQLHYKTDFNWIVIVMIVFTTLGCKSVKNGCKPQQTPNNLR